MMKVMTFSKMVEKYENENLLIGFYIEFKQLSIYPFIHSTWISNSLYIFNYFSYIFQVYNFTKERSRYDWYFYLAHNLYLDIVVTKWGLNDEEK